jgi:two-component system sensor histidine kinase ChiS
MVLTYEELQATTEDKERAFVEWEMVRQNQEATAAELRIKNNELRRLDKLKDEYLENVSHDFRSPLHDVSGTLESLIEGDRGELPPEVIKRLTVCSVLLKRLTYRVENILEFKKLKENDIRLQLIAVDPNRLAENVLTVLKPLADEKTIALHNLVSLTAPSIQADKYRLHQIVHHLVVNAVKFTPHGGRVEISSRREGDSLRIEVIDTGVGIPADKRDEMFEPFNEIYPPGEKTYGGTGLELSIVKKLVELHGSTINVESEANTKTIFSFSLPISSHPSTADESPQNERKREYSAAAIPHRKIEPKEALCLNPNAKTPLTSASCILTRKTVRPGITSWKRISSDRICWVRYWIMSPVCGPISF